jgi:hypothetical protein
VKLTHLAGDALTDDSGVAIDEDAHGKLSKTERERVEKQW